MEVETVVAVSLMMAVFSAVAAVGSSIVLGAGFERLRAGFEIVRKQTGFFSDAIHKLEQKVVQVDQQTNQFSHSISALEAKVTNVGEQANIFSDTMRAFERKVEIVDKQAGFFSDALRKLEKQVEDVAVKQEEAPLAEHVSPPETELISTGKAEALVSHAENLLTQVSVLAARIGTPQKLESHQEQLRIAIPQNLNQFCLAEYSGDKETRFH
jgi:septal ring factor EnvC (AmiA/AmiB activator)